MRQFLIADGIRAAAARTPRKVAITEGSRSLEYRALVDRIDRVANLVHGLGLRHGERAAMLMPNRLEYIEIVCGVSCAGGAAATIGPAAPPAEIRFLCEDSGARVLFVAPELQEAARAAAPACVERFIVLGDEYEALLVSAKSTRLDAVHVAETDVFSIPYTSGATGRPKGVMLTHRGRVLSCHAVAVEHACYGPDDHAIATTPMFHGAGFLTALAPVFFGGSVEILPRFDIAKLLETITRARATSAYMVPTHFAAMFAMGKDLARYDLSSLKTVISGTAPLAQAMKARIVETFGDGRLYERYGSTEASIVTVLRPADQLRKIACVGQPMHATQVRVVDGEGNEVPAGEVGELAVSSPYLFAGYLNLPEATKNAFRGEWYVTGDLAKKDDEGYVYLVDRKSDMIISGGENVYPREVEEILLAQPQVAECGVTGVPHAYWGEQVTAFVVLRAGAAADAEPLLAACRERLSRYKVPKDIRFVPSLPRNSMGKVVRRSLRDLLPATEEPST